MSFTAGTFTLVTGNPVVTGTTISSTTFNSTMSDIATGLSTCLLKDGTQTATSSIPFAQGISVGTNFVVNSSGTITSTSTSSQVIKGPIDISAAGAGQIVFPATQNASANANTLDDYEEGDWTPTDNSGASLVFTGVDASYEKIGRMVRAGAWLTYPSTASGGSANIAGLPFGTANRAGARQAFVTTTDESTLEQILPAQGGTSLGLLTAGQSAITNATMSLNQVAFTALYQV